jgi:very-short-patch-repair endonuclease/predicted transcriptional regulator of viral defense system
MEQRLVEATADMRVAQIAKRQRGVVAYEQLRAAGLSDRQIHSRVRSGRLHRLYRGVYAVGHAYLTHDGRCQAALFALGSTAALSNITAGDRIGLRRSSSRTIHVTVPTAGGRVRRSGIVAHRSTTLRQRDVVVLDGMRTTSVARTLLDLAGTLRRGPLERAVERSLELRVFDLAAVEDVLAANRNARGAATLTRIVADVHHEPPVTRSELEALMRDVCDDHGVERPEVNAIVAGYEVDFLWRARNLIVETDSREHHATLAAFERDRVRDAELATLGYRVVRFTHRRVSNEPRAVAATIVALIDAVGRPATAE